MGQECGIIIHRLSAIMCWGCNIATNSKETLSNPAAILRQKLCEVFSQFKPDCALFSGGLDSVIAAVLTGCKKGIIVTLERDAPDLRYAHEAAHAIDLDLIHSVVSLEQALDAVPEVITTLKSFDPAIPNDLAVYFGLKKAKEMGFKTTITGDGSDELFGGYSYMQSIENLDEYIRGLSRTMSFNSNPLGRHFGIEIIQPFLHPEIIDYALNIGPEWKIRERNGNIHGKWVVRDALKDILPDEILWQGKRPLEIGSGMTRLNAFFERSISDNEFNDKENAYGIHFINKAHLYYYEIYRQTVGDIPKPGPDEKPCSGCGAGMKRDRNHCRVCGWVEEVSP